MITYVSGNIFDSQMQTLVNPVNCVGVMGAGLALQFKQLYPDMFRRYAAICHRGDLGIGKLWLYRAAPPSAWVLNFPTKIHWKLPSTVDMVDAGLAKFASAYQQQGITSIAFPPLGCGLGGLNFARDVKPLMERHLGNLDIPIEIYS